MQLENYAPLAPFAQRHLLTLHDWTQDEILQTLSLALRLKALQKQGVPHRLLEGKTLGMIFTKSSTRTRVSFDVGMHQLGGHPLMLSSADIQLGRGECIEDTARVLSRYVDGIMIRTFAHADVDCLARCAAVPVINALTDDFHPCQVLADLLTIYEHKGTLRGLKLAFVGDGNNMANSLLLGCAKVGMDVSIASPAAYAPPARVVEWAQAAAAHRAGAVCITTNVEEAVRNADIVYTDVWASMGQEAEQARRAADFAGYQVNAVNMAFARPEAIFLHCLPAHRGEEVTADVIDGPQSVVFDQAENRLHAQKAVLALLMK